MGRVVFVFQCATKRRLKTSKLVTKWNIHPQPTPSVALNSDILLEKRPRLDPAVPLHFETFCSQVLVSKTPEAQLLITRKCSFSLMHDVV